MHKYILISILSITLFCSCNPAKMLSRQLDNIHQAEAKLNADQDSVKSKAISDYVAENPCTYPERDLDSVCAGYNFAITPDSVIMPKTDTGKTVVIRTITKHIVVPVTDLRQVKLLMDSIASLRTQLSNCNSFDQGKTIGFTMIPKTVEAKPSMWAFNWWFWILVGITIIAIIYIILRFYSKI